jgi:MFS family permease
MTNRTLNVGLQRPALILALICLPVFIGALDLTIVSAVLPNVILDLRIPLETRGDDAAWVVSGYLLAYTISVALMGRVSDLIGRRRTYFIALMIFILGSWLVAAAVFAPAGWMRRLFIIFSPERPDQGMMALYALIFGRVVQALGAGAMVPVSMALAGDLFPAGRRALPLGVISAVDTAGWVLGHLYGGIMVQFVPWPILFWINIPITTIVAHFTWRQLAEIAQANGEGGLERLALIPLGFSVGVINLLALVNIMQIIAPAALTNLTRQMNGHNLLALAILFAAIAGIVRSVVTAGKTNSDRAPDWIGAGLFAVAIAGLSIGLGGESGTLPPNAIALLALSAISIAGFLFYERRIPTPLFDFAYFRKRNIALAAVINLLVGFCLMVGLVSVPLFINAIVATTPDEGALLSGVLLAALTVPMALASIPGGMLTSRVGYRIPTAGGLLLASIGFALGWTWHPETPQTVIALHLGLAGTGLGLTAAPISTAVINAVKAHERGVGAALVLVMRLIGMTLGTSLMTGYGLRRLTGLIIEARDVAGGQIEADQFFDITREATTRTINEMLVIAALVCAAALIPAMLLRPHDEDSEIINELPT